MTIKLTPEKAVDIQKRCREMLERHEYSIRLYTQLVGKLVACEPAVPHAALFYKPLEHEKDSALKAAKGNFEEKMTLSSTAKQTISWWIDNIADSKKPVHFNPPDISLESDSSSTGWGGLVRGDERLKTGGHWSYTEQSQHINYLELQAAFLTLQCFCSTKSNIHVRLYLDNTVAVNYINNMGGKTTALTTLTQNIWMWCIRRDIWLSACHVPGVQNTEADKLSRSLSDDMEWSLDTSIFERICVQFDTPCIDLFATRVNAKVDTYISYLPDPTAVAIDAFTISWSQYNVCYAFPPFSVLGRVLQKMEEEQTDLILVAPLWTTQPWFPTLLHLLVDTPVLLPNRRPILHLANNPSKRHPIRTLRLTACRLSGITSKREEFQRQLQRSSWQLGEIPPGNNTGSISADGCHFVVNGKVIRFVHL
ncbi:uncharacterized protein [Argopecten irradians]|uniref:uncharacterized protein n=1 Tax=Argopecten irradians TaxID=31199 RepID=UPI0037232610